jgi:PAS domain-containing protein
MVLSDVTASSREDRARERTQVLHTMLESTRHGIALFDRERRVTRRHRLGAELCGLPFGASRRAPRWRRCGSSSARRASMAAEAETDRSSLAAAPSAGRADRYVRTDDRAAPSRW